MKDLKLLVEQFLLIDFYMLCKKQSLCSQELSRQISRGYIQQQSKKKPIQKVIQKYSESVHKQKQQNNRLIILKQPSFFYRQRKNQLKYSSTYWLVEFVHGASSSQMIISLNQLSFTNKIQVGLSNQSIRTKRRNKHYPDLRRIIQNIQQSENKIIKSTYKLGFFTGCLIRLFLPNLIYYLFEKLNKMHKAQKKNTSNLILFKKCSAKELINIKYNDKEITELKIEQFIKPSKI
ncbi:unnamed protein product (macronuclear) [Paramecium tetraurelia]|uniref:Transmembrane protein n=1 Tax=Paramecium tetraurelia TaxID=5888 RepID=A0CW25_PARTE|nr:uncharacterized protein GSPATT00001194001 [Paramecium tetraurelia]CAK74992.1 unnamed protein product [Paramecium tetraurelia]|eukprot:XP_001442389.1 hypothetical protein (macronuclear) [Paramecium tetraurelia strain d4-2]